MPAKKFTTKLIVRETKVIHSGRNSSGGEYTIWQVLATKPDGTRIVKPTGEEWNLRSFSDLPKNEVIEVDAQLYESDKFGDSYTLSRKGEKKGGGGNAQLESRVSTLEEKVQKLASHVYGAQGQTAIGTETAAPPPAQPPPAAAPPATPPPAPPPPAVPDDDDIPF